MFGGRAVAVGSPVRRDDRVDDGREELRDESDLLSAGDVNSRYVKCVCVNYCRKMPLIVKG